MSTEERREIKMVYADPRGDATRNDRVQELLELADHLQTILIPVQPDINFRQRLRSDLDRDARYRQRKAETGLFQQYRTGILIGAAALGSVASVLGVVLLYLFRHRHRGVSHLAAG